jgi:hypothetical protein
MLACFRDLFFAPSRVFSGHPANELEGLAGAPTMRRIAVATGHGIDRSDLRPQRSDIIDYHEIPFPLPLVHSQFDCRLARYNRQWRDERRRGASRGRLR